ncbi:hypothetical protein JCM10212_007124 [Sporobolomyces blumeae]
MKSSFARLTVLALSASARVAVAHRPVGFEHRRVARSPWGYGSALQGGLSYDTCVQQCMGGQQGGWTADAMAQSSAYMIAHASDAAAATETWSAGEAGPATAYAGSTTASTAAATATPAYGRGMGSSSTGMNASTNSSDGGLVAQLYQVIVAPKKGDLRMVPFNINVPKGTNVTFLWGAGPHTVTQSSPLQICNASQAAGAFKSGMREQGFMFPLEVTTDSPMTYFCGVPMHCQKGMFGLINGQMAEAVAEGMGAAMPKMAANDSALADLWNTTKEACKDSPAAWKWGDQIAASQFPDWAMPIAAENILYTRQFFAAFPEALPNSTSSSSNSTSVIPAPTGSSMGGAAVGPASTGSGSAASPASSADPLTAAARHTATPSAIGAVVVVVLSLVISAA